MGNAAVHEPLGRASSALAVRSSHRRSKRHRNHNSEGQGDKARSPTRRMDRLRRSFRDSFRRRKEPSVPESSKPHQWQLDEAAVRAGTCCFHVKYMGCVEVYESRGMQICDEALKVLRNSRRRRVRAILYVSGDGLRVVEDETKGLIVDQTIEKVSFCAPDRNHDKGFSYICRDGTTRRWMCHGFLSLRESGERLSHAVGCAFAACLERKQQRDKDFGVTMKFDTKNSTFTRSGSFRQPSLTERLADPQELRPAVSMWEVVRPVPGEVEIPGAGVNANLALATSPPGFPGVPPSAPTGAGALPGLQSHFVAPRALPAAPAPLGAQGPIALPPTAPAPVPTPGADPVPPAPAHKAGNPYAIERPHATVSMLQRQGSFRGFSQLNQASPFKRQLSLRIGDLPSNLERTRSLSLDHGDTSRLPSAALTALSKPQVSPIPESSPLADRSAPVAAPVPDPVSAMCQQLSQGLLLMSSDDFQLDSLTTKNNNNNNTSLSSANGLWTGPTSEPKDPLAWTSTTLWPRSDGPSSSPVPAPVSNPSPVHRTSPAPAPVAPVVPAPVAPTEPPAPTAVPVPTKDLPRPEQWLGKIANVVNPSSSPIPAPAPAPVPTPRRNPMIGQHTRAFSLGSAESFMGRMNANGHHPTDPFDADWASLAAPGGGAGTAPPPTANTNPFLGNTVKAFEVRM